MKATSLGVNRTGAAVSPVGTKEMIEAAAQLTPFVEIDVQAAMTQRILYIEEADSLGSIAPPITLTGVVKTGFAKLQGGHPALLIDKIGERLAYERSGVRLYDALITKYEALVEAGADVLPPASDAVDEESDQALSPLLNTEGETASETLARIRNEELMHFQLLSDSIIELGGDPTSLTPCADVVGTASIGFMQVLSDPRTTLAQSLNTMLAVELTDNAGWELLIQLAGDAGESDLVGRFLGALSEEQEHLVIVRSWLEALLKDGAGTKAV